MAKRKRTSNRKRRYGVGFSRKERRAIKSGAHAKARHYALRGASRTYERLERGEPLIPAKLKRMPNGRYKIFVSPGAMARMQMNPRYHYSIYTAAGRRVTSDAMLAEYARQGRKPPAYFTNLLERGTHYSNQDFDVLSRVMRDLGW